MRQRVKAAKKEEYVEVTLKLPKRWVQMLEDEEHFNWPKEEFFRNSVRALLSCLLHDMEPSRADQLVAKYGEDISYYELPDS